MRQFDGRIGLVAGLLRQGISGDERRRQLQRQAWLDCYHAADRDKVVLLEKTDAKDLLIIARTPSINTDLMQLVAIVAFIKLAILPENFTSYCLEKLAYKPVSEVPGLFDKAHELITSPAQNNLTKQSIASFSLALRQSIITTLSVLSDNLYRDGSPHYMLWLTYVEHINLDQDILFSYSLLKKYVNVMQHYIDNKQYVAIQRLFDYCINDYIDHLILTVAPRSAASAIYWH